MKLVHVTPAPGMRMLNPFDSFKPLPAGGALLHDDPFWQARKSEGSVSITDPNAKPAQAAQPAKKVAATAPFVKPKV